MKIYIDPGHGGHDTGGTGNGLKEKNIVLDLGMELAKKMENYKCEVKLSRTEDVFVELGTRAREANSWGADLFYSIHTNAHSSSDANGYEDYIYPGAPTSTQESRRTIHRYNAKAWTSDDRANRGRKTANFQVLRETRMAAVLVEHGFVTNNRDAKLLKDEGFKQKLVEAMEKGIVVTLNLEPKNSNNTPILGDPEATVEQAQKWAENRDAHQRFIDIAPTYWEMGKHMGIRPEVAYAQAAHETGYGHYGGVLTPDFNNWAGIKTKEGGANEDPEAHERFSIPDEGVRGHYNHLAAYTGVEPLGLTHGRYDTVMSLDWAGTIKYLEELGGKWAPNPEYGKGIVNNTLNKLLATDFPDQDEQEDWKHSGLNWMVEKGYLNSPEFWLNENRLYEPLPAWAWFTIMKRMKEG